MAGKLKGKVALVDGATRGAGRAIAVELSRSGAYVFATGRSSRNKGPSEIGRPETIEETEEMMLAAGGSGEGVVADHLDTASVSGLIRHIHESKGRLDILVNDIFGGDRYAQYDRRLWEHDIEGGLRMLRMGIDTHLITNAIAIPLMMKSGGGLIIEMTDGTRDYNREFRRGVGMYYDIVKAAVGRITLGLAHELRGEPFTSIAITPGWIRSEAMLDNFGVTEENWRDAIAREPHFCISETPYFVARGIAGLAADIHRERFNGKTLSSFDLSMEYGTTDTDGSRPDSWRYVVEVQDKGLPAGDHGYR